ncbi:MAG: molecular chaperone DnaJ [Cyanosarcina radialis HA8281-LM2]|jgi:DnaJ-domain-containing protein 1|nr:molecular chaperone DnaJ [Cyanosarcina radialis HA8281-LM2]
MTSSLIRRQTPEEQELEAKLAEIAALEAQLGQRELDLATIQAELHAFEREYLQVIGTRYTELDRIEAQIAEYMAYLESSRDFKPSESLKKLYREVAKLIHPDLATDEAERTRRHQLMAEANQAYEDEDEERLRAILHDWESDPDSVKGEEVGAKLIRAIRKIAQAKARLKAIEEEIEVLENTDLYQLKTQLMVAKQAGQDLLAEMAQELDEQISVAQERLTELKAKIGLQK